MKHKLTQQEKNVLVEMELDAQRSSLQVGKTLKLRDYTVQHVIRRLKEKGAIKVKPFIDVSRLGTNDVAVFFSLALAQQKALANLLRQLQNSPAVAFLQSLAGDFHFLAVLHCHSLNDVQSFLRELSQWSKGSLTCKAVIPRVRYRQYRRKYLTGSKKQEEALEALDTPNFISLSEEELALLAYLGQGGIDSIRQAARDLKISYSTADYRYQQLVAKRVIRGWFYDIEDSFLEIQRFKLLISCKHIASDFGQRIEHFCRYHPHTTYLLETLGEWDLEVGIEYAQTADVMNIIALLYESFPGEIATIKSLTELKTFKFTMFPGGIAWGASARS